MLRCLVLVGVAAVFVGTRKRKLPAVAAAVVVAAVAPAAVAEISVMLLLFLRFLSDMQCIRKTPSVGPMVYSSGALLMQKQPYTLAK